MLNKLNPEITYRLFTKLALVLESFINFPKAFIILTDGYVSLDLINHIFTINKQLSSLEDKCAKAIRDN
jgi:hypothetical protein